MNSNLLESQTQINPVLYKLPWSWYCITVLEKLKGHRQSSASQGHICRTVVPASFLAIVWSYARLPKSLPLLVHVLTAQKQRHCDSSYPSSLLLLCSLGPCDYRELSLPTQGCLIISRSYDYQPLSYITNTGTAHRGEVHGITTPPSLCPCNVLRWDSQTTLSLNSF